MKKEGMDEIDRLNDDDAMIDEITEYFIKIDKKAFSAVQRGLKSKADFLKDVENYLHKRRLPIERIPRLLLRLEKYLWGYNILDDLIEDDTISDIKVLDADRIRIKQHGIRKNAPLKFASKDRYRKFVDYVAVKNKTNISDINAIQTFTDKESSDKFILRFCIYTEFVNSADVPYLHIRKIPKKKYSMRDLSKVGMMDNKVAEYLTRKSDEATGILFCGQGGSGKTTLINAMIEEIPHSRSVLVVQENEELFSDTHPEAMFQHVVTSKGEGKIQYTLQDLAKSALISDNDQAIIGEIKGAEALYFLVMCTTGMKAWASIHSNSSTDALDRLTDYIKYASDYTKEEALRMLKSMSCVVFLKDFKVAEISEVVGWDDETNNLKYRKIL